MCKELIPVRAFIETELLAIEVLLNSESTYGVDEKAYYAYLEGQKNMLIKIKEMLND